MPAQKYLIIHCTATRQGREVTAEELRRWHTAPPPRGRGWQQVGYTDMFHLDGTVERLVENNEDNNVDTFEITNGAAGYNSFSRHIVYVGGCDDAGKAKDTRTEGQKRAMERYVKAFHSCFPFVKIVGHNELNKTKACPSFDVQKWLQQIGILQ